MQEMKPYLGDVIDDEPIYRPAPRKTRRELLEPTIRSIVALLAFPFYGILIAIALAMVAIVFVNQNRAIGQVISMPSECAALARLVGLPPAPTLDQASWAIDELKKREHDSYPGVRACREAIRRKMPKPR